MEKTRYTFEVDGEDVGMTLLFKDNVDTENVQLWITDDHKRLFVRESVGGVLKECEVYREIYKDLHHSIEGA